MSKSENLNYLKECFSGVGSDNPTVMPIPLYFFKLDHAKLIMEYLITTLIHHYSLYEYLYTQEQDELIIGTDLCTEVCSEMNGPFPPPLEEGMPIEIFENFHLSKTKDAQVDDEAADASFGEELTDAVLKAVEASESEAVKTVPATELRRIIEKITREMIIPAKTELRNKIKEKETGYLTRIEKIQPK
uniref:Uncharacterized protein C10orf107 homolog n=1 Tax=Phallusia mammillata TaxID=59560 RepID=A0A6F9D8S3_9ASCI|nr:uncharacterized protein C10orf107 homolog [Phallusia mammillata]